ncbi:MAG: TolC family protein [Bdellovibrionales bacterium]|nr:TolC family protein [Bdellovibrionales bacterium]
MISSKLFFLGVLAAKVAGAQSPEVPTPEHPWTLKALLSFALQHSPTVLTAEESARQASAGETVSLAALLPQLDFNSTHGLASTASVTSGQYLQQGNWISQAGIVLSASLYDNGKSWTAYRTAGLARERAELALKNARAQLALDLIRAFHDYSYQVKSFDVLREQTRLLERQYRSADYQYRQGLRTAEEALRFKIKFQRAEIDQDDARESLRRASRELFRLAGMANEFDAETLASAKLLVPTDLEQNPGPVAAKTIDPESTVEVRLARLSTQVVQGSVDISRRTLWPELGLTASTGYSANGYLRRAGDAPSSDAWNSSVLLTLDYKIWDWGGRRNQYAQQLSQRAASEIDARRTALDIHVKLQDLESDLRRLQALYTSALDLRRLEESSYRELESRYRDGKTDYLNFVEGANSFLQAKQSLYSTVRDLLKKSAERQYYEGTLNDSFQL